MNARRIAGAILPVVLMTVSCHSTTGPGDLRDRIEAARALWADAEPPGGYAMRQTLACFCPPPRDWTVAISGGQPQFIVEIHDEDPSGDPRVAEQWALQQSLSVDAAFDWIEARIGRADRLIVDFDPDRGFPTRIEYDGSVMAVDDELLRTFADLVELGACTQIGCGDGLFVSIVPAAGSFAPGVYEVSVAPSFGPVQTCTFEQLASCWPEACFDSACAVPYGAPLRAVARLEPVDGPASLTIRRDGAVVVTATIDPVYERSQPNGPLCPPVCWQATVEIGIP